MFSIGTSVHCFHNGVWFSTNQVFLPACVIEKPPPLYFSHSDISTDSPLRMPRAQCMYIVKQRATCVLKPFLGSSYSSGTLNSLVNGKMSTHTCLLLQSKDIHSVLYSTVKWKVTKDLKNLIFFKDGWKDCRILIFNRESGFLNLSIIMWSETFHCFGLYIFLCVSQMVFENVPIAGNFSLTLSHNQ